MQLWSRLCRWANVAHEDDIGDDDIGDDDYDDYEDKTTILLIASVGRYPRQSSKAISSQMGRL